MNEKAIQDAYKLFKQSGYTKSINEFRVLMSSNQNAVNDAYKLFKQSGYTKSVDDFKVLMGSGAQVKKKPTSESGSTSGKLTSVSSTKEVKDAFEARDYSGKKYVAPKQNAPTDSTKVKSKASGGGEILESKNAKYRYSNGRWYAYTDTSFDKKTGAAISNYNTMITDTKRVKTLEKMFNKAEYLTGYPGKEEKEYRFKYNQWYEDDKSGKGFKVIQDPLRVTALNKQFNKQGSTSPSLKTFVGYPGKETNEYRISDDGNWMRKQKGQKDWTVITNPTSVTALNKQFGQKVKVLSDEEQKNASSLNDLQKGFNQKIDSVITSKLTDSSEEYVVETLRKQFQGSGFTFNEEGAMKDRMIVTAPNGAKKMIILDNWTFSEDKAAADELKEFMRANGNLAFKKAERNLIENEGYFLTKDIESQQAALRTGSGQMQPEQRELKIKADGSIEYADAEQLKENKKDAVSLDIEERLKAPEVRRDYFGKKQEMIALALDRYKDKDMSDPELRYAYGAIKADDKEIKRQNDYVTDINKYTKDYNESKKINDAYVEDVQTKLRNGEITMDQYEAEYKPKIEESNEKLKEQSQNIQKDLSNISKIKTSIDKSIAQNFIINESKGSIGGGMAYNFAKGLTDITRFFGVSKEEQDKMIRDATGIITTEEFMNSEDRWDVSKAMFSITESLGTLPYRAIPYIGPALAAASLYSMGYYELKDDLDSAVDEQGNKLNISERDKVIMSSLYGIVSAALENTGLDAAIGKGKIVNSVTNRIIKDSLKGVGKNASKEFIEASIITNAKKFATDIASKAIKGQAVEGATEGLQNLAMVSTKEVYDQLNDTQYFNNEGAKQIAIDALYDAYLGSLGGGITNVATKTPQAIRVGVNSVYKKPEIDMLIQSTKTEGMNEALITNLKASILKGDISKQEAKNIVDSFQTVKSKVDSMTPNLSIDQQSVTLDLMLEKDRISKEIEGKDPNLVVVQKARIGEIDKQIQKIGEDAVQKQTTGEVPVQSKTGVGEEVARGVSQPTTEQVTEEVVGEEEKVQGKEVKVFDFDGKKYEVTNESTTDLETGNLVPMDLATQIQQEGVLLETKPIQVKEVTEVAPKAEIGGIIRGYESISEQDNVGDVRSQLPNQNQGTAVVEGKDGNQYAVAFSRKGGDGKNIFEQGVTTPRPGYISASVKIEENATPEQVQAAQQEAQRNLDIILPTVVGGSINAKAINDVMAQQAPAVQAETVTAPEMGTTEVAPSTEAELDFEVTPEVTQEADALEKLLADEGITIEAPVVEQPVAEEVAVEPSVETGQLPVTEEATAVKSPIQQRSEQAELAQLDKDIEASISNIQEIEDQIEIERGNIAEEKQRIQEEKAKVKASKMPRAEKAEKLEQLNADLKDYLDDVNGTIETYQSDLKAEKSDIRKAKLRKTKIVGKSTPESAPVAEAKPVAKPKAAKKLTVKEIVQKYNDYIDSLIKAEKERSDRRIAQLANQRNSATGQRRSELTQEIQDLEFAFNAKKRGLESKKDDKQAAKDFNDQGNIKPADILFQLDSDQETTDRKQELLDIATAMMEEAEKEGLSETAFTAEQPEPQVELITIDIKENTELANKVKRMGFAELIGKKINLVMADQLKVGKGLMGGPFFPLINKLFGKVAWASINNTAAIKIINGAIKSDYTVVYNMKPEAIDSNVAVLDSFEQKIKALPAKMQKQVFTELTEYLNEKKFGEKTDDIRKMASESKNLNEFLTKLNELDVDTIAAVVKSVLPSKTVNAGTKIGATLQSQNISIEDIRAENIEQFVANLPAGALTMVLQVTDKNGNKVTKQTAREALISREQQKAEGLPTHKNYPVYIRGKAVGILKETTQFWNVFKDSLNEINVKVAGIVKHSTGRSLTSKEAISNEMRSASMTASQARNVMEPTVDMYKKFVSLLSRSIPGVTVVTSQQEFNDLLDNLNVQKLSTKTQKVYGAVYKGKIYLNPSLQNYNTPIHEFGHIWLNVTKTANKELYNKGIDLIKGSEYVDQIKNNKDYQRVINEMINNGATQEEVDNYIYEEALATAIGDKGESFVKASQALKDFKTWLDKLYSFVRKITGISKYTPEQLQDISLDEFLQAVSVDLLSGEKLFDVTEGSMSDALQLMSKSDDISKIVDIAAKNGVSNEAVKVLLARRGFSISDINAALVKKAAPIKKGKVSKVTVNEKTALKDQIRFEARAARDAKKDLNEKRKDLAKTISEMETTGKITTKQAQALMARISKLNMDNPAKVDAFIEYAGRVFENAEFAQDVARANSLKSKVKANAKTKLGIANDLISEILAMASINPSLIPSKVFDTYMETMEMLGQRAAVLKLEERGELTQKVADILDAVNEELSVASEMAERFEAYDKKEVDSEGKVEFAKTLDKMVADGTITKEDADIMRKYKSEIVDKESTKMTEEELEAEKKSLIEVLKKDTISDEAIGDLPSRLERDLAESIKSLLKTDAVKSLNNTTLKNLLKLVDNINNGFVPHYAQVMKERLTAIDNAPALETSIKKGNPLRVGSFTGRIKSLFTKRNYVLEMIRSTALGNIDQVFGDFKTNNIFKSLFESSAKGIAAFNSQLGVIQDKLEKAKQDVAKSLRKDPNRVTMSSFKTMTYLLQLEKDSNPDSKQVNNAVDFINATIDQIEKGASSYTEMDAEFLQEILDTYTKDGKLDINKLYNSFNATEKAAIKTIQEVNDSMTEKAVYTAGIIRGDKINPIANYVPHVVLEEAVPGKEITGANDVANFSNSRKPSTKAKNLVERTGAVTAISFDPYQTTQNAAKNVLLDFHMTEPIRTARMTINETRKRLEENGITPDQRTFLNAINNSYEEATQNVLANSFQQNELLNKVVEYIAKAGYKAVLGTSITRTASELGSNFAAVVFMNPKAFGRGVSEFSNYSNPEEGLDIMLNVGSAQTERVMGGNTQGGMLVDPAISKRAVGMKDTKAKNKLASTMQRIYNRSLKHPANWVDATSDVLMSSPDTIVTRPTWFGAFANEFEKVAGKKVDFDKIKANDEAYINENKNAIESARKKADKSVFNLSATNNMYMGLLKNNISPDSRGIAKALKVFDNYLTRFTTYEYLNARTAIYALFNQGMIGKKEATGLLLGVTTRMIAYSLLTKTLFSLMFGGDDEDDDKSFMQKLGQAGASAATTLLLGRNFGNIARNVMGYGAEKINEKYLTALREGEYDAYQDAIQYTILPQEKKSDMGKGVDVSQMFYNMLGPTSPFVKSFVYGIEKFTEQDRVAPKSSDSDAVKKKRSEAVLRQQRERNIRVPLEVIGTLGRIPFYKDIRRVVNDWIYSDLKKSLKEQEVNKKKKEEMLMGYESKSEMEEQNPKLYERLYGEDGKYYAQEEVRLAKENLKSTLKKIEKESRSGEISYSKAIRLKQKAVRTSEKRIRKANR